MPNVNKKTTGRFTPRGFVVLVTPNFTVTFRTDSRYGLA